MPELSLIAALVGGLVLLAFAGDFLVAGAVSIAQKLGISPLVAGIFIVGFGTSAPEMVVAVDAAIGGYPSLALGNIVGSNIANVWLVLGLPALIAPLATGGYGERRALLAMLAATALWIGLSAVMPLHSGIGVFFLLILIGYVIYTFRATAKDFSAGVNVGVDEEESLSLPRTIAFTLIGIVGLPIGAHLIVEGGVGVARSFQVPEEVIGLTLIAIGTSLPEMGAGIAAALRGRGTVLIGNVLGSNIFNILGAGGLVALFSNHGDSPLQVTRSFHAYDHWAMTLAALTVAAFILRNTKIGRLMGILLLLIYALYIFGLTQGWDILALFGV
ncbi:MAG: calcium/sodium antiporter [Pseudomonadota bacterium]